MPLSDPALRRDDDGAIRVAYARVLLETVLEAFDVGETPEQIVVSFPSLRLADVYAAIAFALRHTDEVAAYLRTRSEAGAAARVRAEAVEPMALERERLLARTRRAS